MSDKIANLLYPHITSTPDDILAMYPKRNLCDDAQVTRFAPSPTGFIHIGGIMAALLNWKIARQTKGVFILRIEDTDQNRKIDNGVDLIHQSIVEMGFTPDEGPCQGGSYYGPYIQSQRLHIYWTFAKELVRQGLAYPCFLTKDELEVIRNCQTRQKLDVGVYGSWAVCRDYSFDDVKDLLDAGKEWVLRLKSPDTDTKIVFDDFIRGKVELQANHLDTVLLKADGYPTYHFAHPIDDALMGVTLVIRGDEWLNTTPIHLQLFQAMSLKCPHIAHIAPIGKMDGTSKRKLSKRHDPEAAMDYYWQLGYTATAISEYLVNLLDGDFESWRNANPSLSWDMFPINLAKLSHSISLFDLDKLNNISKNVVAALDADTVYSQATQWANKYDSEFASLLYVDQTYATKVFNLGRGIDNPRKDITTWSDIPKLYKYFFASPCSYATIPLNVSDIREALDYFTTSIEVALTTDNATWFAAVRQHALDIGYAKNNKIYQSNPNLYKGTISDYVSVLRVVLSGRLSSPDIHQIIGIMGKNRVVNRINVYKSLM